MKSIWLSGKNSSPKTPERKFVDRSEVARIALESGQIKNEVSELQSYHLI